ncbi:MAG: hypothetical protein K2Y22_00410 [Candidatus Obscuribacterales bacterium]|nr:hypothetical protein [Candidatus Obscuribacterales bacterium]
MKIINPALILCLAITAGSAIPSFAQSYPSWDPRWQGPVWLQSTNGEFYDATGTIKGTVPVHALGQFGGRMDAAPSGFAPGFNAQAQQLWYLEQMRRNRRHGVANFLPIW